VALKTTSIELIGRVAKWVAYNPLYIPDILQTLTSCLSHAGLAVCASESLSEVLRACTHVMTPFSLPIHDLHDLVSRQRDAHALPLSADLNLLDGICTAMSSFDQQTCGAMLSAVVAPIARSLSSQLTQGYVHDTHLVMANIDRLTAVVRFTRVNYVSGEHPVMAAFLLLQPLCQRVLEVVTTEQACEKVCRLYKYSIRSTGKCFATYLRPMSVHLLTAFQSKQYSPLIYAASICVTEFGSSHGAHDELLYSMLWGFSSAFFAKCQTLTDFQNYPDVVEEYFHLLARYCTVYCVLCTVHCVLCTVYCTDRLYITYCILYILYMMMLMLCNLLQLILNTLVLYCIFPHDEYIHSTYSTCMHLNNNANNNNANAMHLYRRYLEFCPGQLVSSPQVQVLIQAGLTGLQLRHRDATKGVLHFFDRLIAVSGTVTSEPNMTQAADNLVHQYGSVLLSILIKDLLEEAPTYPLHESSGSVVDVVWRLKQRQAAHLPVWNISCIV
jgi:hypothetical protein